MKKIYFFTFIVLIYLAISGNVFSMTRTLKKEPAIVIVAFGTTTKAKATFDFFNEQMMKDLSQKYRHLHIEWAFTSEIIRGITNKRFREKGVKERYKSLLQVLADLEDEGYRKVAIQPLHIFPGQEYHEMIKIIEAFRTLGLRIEYGGTLLHRWEYLEELMPEIEKGFLKVDKGCNILIAHGTPQTFPTSNITYIGLDRNLKNKYKNVFIGSVDGVLTRNEALNKARACKEKRIRMVPFMYVAGDHIMNDIMGTEPDDEGVLSWTMELQKEGFRVDAATFEYKGEKYFKGLGFYKSINHHFIHQLEESLKRLKKL